MLGALFNFIFDNLISVYELAHNFDSLDTIYYI